jgi:hypothetical protein
MAKIKKSKADILDRDSREIVMNVELQGGEAVSAAPVLGPTINSRKKRDAARLALRRIKKKSMALHP